MQLNSREGATEPKPRQHRLSHTPGGSLSRQRILGAAIEVDAEWNPGPEMDELIVEISPTDSHETVQFEVDWESFRSKYEASWLG